MLELQLCSVAAAEVGISMFTVPHCADAAVKELLHN
jgi:Class-II DAHP synthetase family